MSIQAEPEPEPASTGQIDNELMALHISQVPQNVGLIRVVKDLAHPGAEIDTDGSWSLEEIERLSIKHPQLMVELQVTSDEKLDILVDQVTRITEKKLALDKMFDDVAAVKEQLRNRVRDVFDEKINSYRNKMTEVSYGVDKEILTTNAKTYSKLISYSTECFALGMLFVEYLDELSERQQNNLGKSLILHKIGYIESMEDSNELQARTIAILETERYDHSIVQFARDQGTTRFKGGKLKGLVRATEIGKIVTHYCNCTVNYPRETPPYKTIANYESILESTGRRREMMFEPTLLTKFIEMIKKGLEMRM